ncbi:MAG: DUF1080 domain-containing protein [Verrucomicrobiales bacterium]
MRTPSLFLPFAAFTLAAAPLATAQQFYGDPPDETHPWAVHDMNRPQPPRVEPGTFSTQAEPGKPPSDAVILFDGTEASMKNWTFGKPDKSWALVDGAFQCVPGSGSAVTKEQFGDCQLHIEWSAPTDVKGDSQGRGNSGVFLPGNTEVQVLDNYNNPTYADGFAGSVYGVMPPMANALRKPGEWQVYDIVFRRPLFKDGKEIDPGRVTVFCNGVLLQDSTPLEGGGGHKGRSHPRAFPEKGPLSLQDHGNTTRFRNIWYRPLPPRAAEGGTDGQLSPEATEAKRKEIAAEIRKDAAGKQGKDKMLRLMESLCYEVDPAALEQSTKMLDEFLAGVKATPKDKAEGRKGEVMQVRNAVDYLMKHKRLPGDFAAKGAINEIVKENGWDK